MSLLWKKFRKSGGSPSHSSHAECGAVAQSPLREASVSSRGSNALSSRQSSFDTGTAQFISETDEKLFMTDEGGREDPLLVESQFVKTLSDIFSSHSTLPYFLQFLQGWGSDKYARFWLDVTSFRASAETRIHSTDSHVPHDKVMGGEPLVLSEKGRSVSVAEKESTRTKYENVVNCTQSDLLDQTVIKNDEGEAKSREKRLALPDLVSNIKTVSDVTPLNSPEYPSPIRDCNNPFPEMKDRPLDCILVPKGKDLLTSDKVQSDSDLLKSSVKSDNSVRSSPKLLSRAQKLRQSIADDALRIFQKYLSKEAEQSIGIDDPMREEIYQKICVMHHDISPDCFNSAQAIAFNEMEKEFLPKFLASDYYLKHQIDVLTSGSVRLADILCSDSALPYLMEYAEQESGRSMLQFWIATSNFRQQLMPDTSIADPQQAQSDAMVLYDKYFSLQATCPLGFSDDVRYIVEGNICCEDGPSYECFDLPLRVVLHILERDFLEGYLSSSLHIRYLSELINTVKTSAELHGRKKRSGSESTCSSEQSSSQHISSYNTLLVMESTTLAIDAARITDPDSLWRRKNFSKMSCGFINELGRFESDLQPEPDRKTESKISRTLKKFVNMDENKVKEDMAYKVAEMIIKDVTSVTLGSHQSSTRSSVGSSVPPLSPSSTSQDNLSDVFSS